MDETESVAPRSTPDTRYAVYARTRLPAGKVPMRPYTLCPHDSGWLIEDTWPSIYYGRERVAEARRKAQLPWGRKIVENLRAEAELVLQQPPQLPVEQVGWRHDFYSRRTGAHLLYEPEYSESYLDPTTGQREHDQAQRKAWVLLTRERTYRMMRSLGLLYQLSGEEHYASWVAAGLRNAAEYSGHTEFRNGDALYFSSLYDAGMLLLLANAYDLVRDSKALSPQDHQLIRAGIFDERIPSLMQFIGTRRAHNMGCFAGAAIATAGEIFNEPDRIELALHGDNGLRDQLIQGVPANKNGEVDGFWREGTTFYHFYSLCALVPLYEIGLRHDAVTDDLRRRYEAMFDAPVQLSDEQLRVPPLGDLGDPRTMHLGAYRHLYEYAAGTLNTQRLAPVLAAIYENIDVPRTDIAALIYGPDELPLAEVPAASTLLPVAGIGVFRAQQPAPFWLAFRCGRYSGGHDHPDRLSIFLHAHGVPISPDLGEPGYSLRSLHSNYFRNTLAHNTLFVNEAEQAGEATLDWRDDCARGVVNSEGITLSRTIFFDPPYIVLLDEFESETEKLFSWIHHGYGAIGVLQSGETVSLELPPLPVDCTWSNLRDRSTLMSSGSAAALWQVTPEVRLHLRLWSDGPFEITSATSPGQPYADYQGTLLLRAPGRTRRFASVFEANDGEATVQTIMFAEDTGIRVTLRDGSERVYRWGLFDPNNQR